MIEAYTAGSAIVSDAYEVTDEKRTLIGILLMKFDIKNEERPYFK
jgi:hypothetical protein